MSRNLLRLIFSTVLLVAISPATLFAQLPPVFTVSPLVVSVGPASDGTQAHFQVLFENPSSDPNNRIHITGFPWDGDDADFVIEPGQSRLVNATHIFGDWDAPLCNSSSPFIQQFIVNYDVLNSSGGVVDSNRNVTVSVTFDCRLDVTPEPTATHTPTPTPVTPEPTPTNTPTPTPVTPEPTPTDTPTPTPETPEPTQTNTPTPIPVTPEPTLSVTQTPTATLEPSPTSTKVAVPVTELPSTGSGLRQGGVVMLAILGVWGLVVLSVLQRRSKIRRSGH